MDSCQHWMAAYAQLLSVTTDGKMKPGRCRCGGAGRARHHGGRRPHVRSHHDADRQKMTKAASEEDMNDEIGF